jgi:hypothetical protein
MCRKWAKMGQFQGLSGLAVLTTPDSSGPGFVGLVCSDSLGGWLYGAGSAGAVWVGKPRKPLVSRV